MEVTKPIKVGNYWTNLVDSVAGESANYEVTLTWHDGSPMDDSKCDGVIYRKLPASVGGGYVKRVFVDGNINVKWFGAVGDGSTDDSAAIQRAADVAASIRTVSSIGPNTTLFFPSDNIFAIEDTITIAPTMNVEMRGRLLFTGVKDKPGLIIGSSGVVNAASTLRLNIYSSGRSDWTEPNHTGIRLINCSRCDITIDLVDGFYKGLECIGDDAGFVYNKVYIKRILCCKYGVYLDYTGSNGYCNENKFYGGNFGSVTGNNQGKGRVGARITGDDNVFLNPSFELNWQNASPELAQAAVFDDAIACKILHCRNEANSWVGGAPSGPAFVFNGTSIGNSVEVGYTYDRQRGTEAAAVQDNSVTKQNRYRSALEDFPEGGFGHIIYDSGNLAEGASRYAGANQLTIPRMLFANYSLGTFSQFSPSTEVAQIVNSGGGSFVRLHRNGFAIRISTTYNKKFLVIRDAGSPFRAGRTGIKCFNSSGEEITSESNWLLDEAAPNSIPSQIFAWSTDYGGCYLTGTPTPADTPVYFSVKPEVDYIYLILGNPSNYTELRSFQVYSLENELKATTEYSTQASFDNHKIFADWPPSDGTYLVGERLYARNPGFGDTFVRVCSAAGTFTPISVTGDVEAGSPVITNIADTTGIQVGDWVDVENSTGPTPTVVSKTASSIRLSTSTGLVTGTGLNITNHPPSFRAIGVTDVHFSGFGGSPEGTVTAHAGAIYQQISQSGTGTAYVKATGGLGNTGWAGIVTENRIATPSVKGVVNAIAAQANISQSDLTAIATPDATDEASAVTLVNAIKAFINNNAIPLINATKASQNTELTNQRAAGQQDT